MQIRIGYDIELGISSPMALLFMLRVHPSRRDDLRTPEAFAVSPELPVEEYIDSFGNHCGRVNAPAGTALESKYIPCPPNTLMQRQRRNTHLAIMPILHHPCLFCIA